MKSPFSVGDLVVLKSGGPVMTVDKVIESIGDREISVRCQWFAGKKMEAGVFPVASLNPHTGEVK
jgi:uncharacterized protein YodC (DUF2158 family)